MRTSLQTLNSAVPYLSVLALWVLGLFAHALIRGTSPLWPLPLPALAATAAFALACAFLFLILASLIDARLATGVSTTARWLSRFLVLFVAPLVAGYIWPILADRAKTVDVAAALVQTHSSQEVLVSGFVNDPLAPAFSLQKLTIKEPQKPAYDRLVSLSDSRQFELALGEPLPGAYSVIVHWRSEQFQLPELVVGNLFSRSLPLVRLRQYDPQQLFVYPIGAGLIACALLVLRLRIHRAKPQTA